MQVESAVPVVRVEVKSSDDLAMESGRAHVEYAVVTKACRMTELDS